MELFGAAAGLVFVVLFVLASLAILGIGAFIVFAIVRNTKRARELGHDPLTMEVDMASRVMDSQLLQPTRSIEERLTELDDLRARGVITEDEYAKARTEAIAS